MSGLRNFACVLILVILILLPAVNGSADATPLAACKATSANFNAQEMQLVSCYQKEVGAASIMMLETDFPATQSTAITMGKQMAASLIAWHKADVTPLVMFDPTLNGSSSANMNLYAFYSGSIYYQALSTYFQAIKSSGITTDEMGLWVPFDEPNLPEWYRGIVSPSLFDRNVNSFATDIRTFYPGVKLSVMLNSQTCQTGWINCQTADNSQTFSSALEPYLMSLKTTNLSSFGFEGYTWSSVDNASQYLNGSVAIDGASTIGVKDVWFNTGTYQIVEYNHVISRATLSRRGQVLNQIFSQVSSAQSAGINVDFVNIFSQNVLDGDGSANYSYDYSDPTTTSDALNGLKTFISKNSALSTPVPVAVFDAEGN